MAQIVFLSVLGQRLECSQLQAPPSPAKLLRPVAETLQAAQTACFPQTELQPSLLTAFPHCKII